MSSYDGLEIFKQHLQEEHERGGSQNVINPKLKQFFEVKTKIEPFYTGGKFSVLSPSLFLAKCGESVKLISTEEIIEIKQENDNIKLNEDIKPPKPGSFGIIGHFESNLDEIISFDGCPTTNVLITAHKSQLIRIWNLKTKEITRTIKSFHTVPIGILEIHRSKALIEFLNYEENEKCEDYTEYLRNQLTWGTVAGNVIKIWDGGGSIVSKAIRMDGITSIGFIKWDYSKENEKKNGGRLFIAERNIFLIEYDDQVTKQFQVSKILEGHYSQVTGIEWYDGNIMISGGRDKTIILWDTKNDGFLKIKSFAFPGVIESMILLSGKDLYIAASPPLIKHFDMITYKLSNEPSLQWSVDEPIIALHPIHNSTNFFISTHTSCIYQVEKINSNKKKDNRLQINKQFVGALDEILAVILWGKERVAVATNTSVIKVYNLESGSCIFLRGHTDTVLTLAVQNDWLVSGSKDNRIIFWSINSIEPQNILDGHLGSVSAVCFHPNELKIYSVADDNFLKIWDNQRCLNSVIAHEKEVHSVDCSHKGVLLATGSRDRTAKIWDAKTLKVKAVLKGHKKSVWDVKFSSWDQLIVTSSADATLKIWNILTYDCIHTLQGHTSSVLQGRFINSGLQILSSSSDGTWKSWDIRTSLCLSTLESSNDKIWTLDSEPDGSIVVTGSADSILTIWKDITEQKFKEATEKRKKFIEDEQRLKNYFRKGDWSAAIRLAIELDRPYAILKILRGERIVQKLEPTITSLSIDDKKSLMKYVKQWNTNTKTSTEAQYILNMILMSTLPEQLESLDINSLLPYTIKHFQRLQKTQQYVTLVQYIADSQKDPSVEILDNQNSNDDLNDCTTVFH